MFVKVYGERNTGTHFLSKLLKINTDLAELRARKVTRKKSELKKLLSSFSSIEQSPVMRRLIRERLIDAQRERQFEENFGWKHAAVDIRRVEMNPQFDQTLFICLIRNPWRFISALHRRPYNYLPEVADSLKDFIVSPLIANSRDGLKNVFQPNPVELWNQKVASYLEFAGKYPENVRILYYESLLMDVEGFLKSIKDCCKVKPKTKIPSRSTKRSIKTSKRDSKTFQDYKREVEQYDPSNALGFEKAVLIQQRLDKNVFAKTLYASLRQYQIGV